MPRPCKRRRVRGKPKGFFFKPAGIRKNELELAELELAEFEALRLVDYMAVSQEEAAKEMRVSQPTLSRILKQARKKLADAIINGKAIVIEKPENQEKGGL